MRSHPARRLRYGQPVKSRERTAQEEAEGVLAQIEGAIRVAKAVNAPADLIERLRAIHRRLHQQGLQHELQASIF